MKKRADQGASQGPLSPFPDASWSKNYPTICEYLSHMEYEDGTKRELATLTVKEQEGQVLVVLNDKDTSASAYVTGSDVLAALRSLEKALVGGNADWRRWKVGAFKKKGG